MGSTCTKAAKHPIIEAHSLPTILEPEIIMKDKPIVTDASLIVRDYAKAIEPIVLSKKDIVTDVIYAGAILTAIYTFIIALNT